MDLIPNMEALLYELTRRGVRFVVVGGLAGQVYCARYSTDDLDICHARDPQNLQLIAELLADLHAEFRRLPQYAPPAMDAFILSTETDFVFNTSLGKLDLIGLVTGVGLYEEASEDAVWVEMGRQKVKVLSLPKLMAAKKSAGREKDLSLLAQLEGMYGRCDQLESACPQEWSRARESDVCKAAIDQAATVRLSSAS
jgi:predicted nucleotidyltransferase